ncbi:hypothetical protein ACLB2K_034253 [Fragaria x ananassa]
MASYLKSIDGNHLQQTNPKYFQVGIGFIANNEIPGIDFATVHSYPDQWRWTTPKSRTPERSRDAWPTTIRQMSFKGQRWDFSVDGSSRRHRRRLVNSRGLLWNRCTLYADGVDRIWVITRQMNVSSSTLSVVQPDINEYGAATLTFSNDIIDEYSLKLLIVAIGVGISAFIEGFCWTRTAERQTSRMRMEYLKSVLKQDFAFFDSQANSSMTFQVISTNLQSLMMLI